MLDEPATHSGPSRRTLLKFGAAGAAALGLGGARVLEPSLARKGLLSKDGVFEAASMRISDSLYIEDFPTSPLILNPFNDPLPIPQPAKPIPPAVYRNWPHPPGLGKNQQNFISQLNANGDPVVVNGKVQGAGNETHQIPPAFLATNPPPDPQGAHPPIVYKFSVRSGHHVFTTSQVLPIDDNGQPTVSFDATGRQYPAGTVRSLPPALIWGFADAGLPGTPTATFPGPMINAEYGKPVLVRFSDDITRADLDTNQDFGAPDGSFLTHLHNGHTAPESDGNPHYAMRGNPETGTPTGGPHHEGFTRGSFVDQMYLNWPAGNDFREKQSFFWFHDHRMDHTGANVYKGMVGLYPLYDPAVGEIPGVTGRADAGNENEGLRLPGIRTDNGDGSFSVKYDIPLAIYDCSFDDGVTIHKDFHDGQGEFPQAGNPRTHPEWWGLLFHKHFPNHGFVGDIFTVNGTAFPVLTVNRRKYRFRFLDCSVSRIYEFKMMTSTQGPKSAVSLGYGGDELDGQYRIEDGQQCMKWTQIATDGGLLPAPIVRDSFELWPAKRREFIVDFTKYMDGTPTKTGDVIWLTNVMKMGTGRMWDSSTRFSPDPNYKIPMMKIIIGGVAPDNSQVPTSLRPLPKIPPLAQLEAMMANRLIFEVQRGSAGGELEWLINGKPFDPFHELVSLENPAGQSLPATPKENSFNLWELRNGGGGWVHPIHIHQEEHRDITRNGVFEIDANGNPRVDRGHPDDASREDLAALDPGESVVVYRGFRDFVGPYVAHCHNLLHEDHAMMFGWSIVH